MGVVAIWGFIMPRGFGKHTIVSGCVMRRYTRGRDVSSQGEDGLGKAFLTAVLAQKPSGDRKQIVTLFNELCIQREESTTVQGSYVTGVQKLEFFFSFFLK